VVRPKTVSAGASISDVPGDLITAEQRDMRAFSTIAALAAVGLAGACGGGTMSPSTGVIGPTGGGGGNGGSTGGGGGGGAHSNAVSVGNNFYSPSATTVPVGTTVTWTWDAGDVVHTVTFDADTTIMSPFQSSGTYSRNFSTAGTYHYHCSIHGFAMTGMVTVR
jgi:plastocyanin